MELSKRLNTVANLVTQGLRVADIGCDHGYISIYLISNKKSPKVIAMDINEGPLQKAQEHISQYGMADYIETRLSNGAEVLKEDEVDTAVIAGMGGRLILQIISQDRELFEQLQDFVIQPQSEIDIVRETLFNWGFSIILEDMVYEDGKFYPILKCSFSKKKEPLCKEEPAQRNVVEYKYGRYLLENRNKVLFMFLQKEKKKYHTILVSLKNRKEKTSKHQTRIHELELELKWIEEALSYYG